MGRWLVPVFFYFVFPALVISCVWAWNTFTDFVERDPGFCALCHETRQQYVLWVQSEHRDVVCQDCHHQTPSEALGVIRQYVFSGRGGDAAGGGASHKPKVAMASCAACHLQHDRRWPEISNSIGHRLHVVDAKIDCLRCHARSMHSFDVTLESCRDCHEEQVHAAAGMEKLHCLACHNFLDTADTLRPSSRICDECHRSEGIGSSAFPANAPMAKLPCWACHRPHAAEGASDVTCGSCHEEVERLGLHATPGHAKCADCHAAHTWTTKRRQCTSCHKDMVSHRADKPCWSCHEMGTRPQPTDEEAP